MIFGISFIRNGAVGYIDLTDFEAKTNPYRQNKKDGVVLVGNGRTEAVYVELNTEKY